MKKKDLYATVFAYFERVMPPQDTELNYNTPFELLVAVILSAQCTDKRINQVTPALFLAYPTPEAMSQATPDEIFGYIRSVSYPNNKAKHLVGMSQRLVTTYGGQIPDCREELITLPGVGRKTANVILGLLFNQAALAVDTHVFRVSHRLKLVPKHCTTPLLVERELSKHIPDNKLTAAHFYLLYHGRYTCTARAPKCATCELKSCCASFA